MLTSYVDQYLFIALLTGAALFFGIAPIVLARFIAPKKPGASKQAPYECGVESTGDSWVQFRVQYYVYALLFVIFDVEVVFIFPWAITFKGLSQLLGPIVLLEMALFLAILGVGLAYAWKRGVLEWE